MSVELLGLGLNFMSGLMGRSSQKRQQREQMMQAQRQFDAQMNESVQRRVKDAKAAGVHPLFALGASVGASPTISAQGESRGDPMQGALSSMASVLNGLETNKAQAARDHAQAALFDAEKKRIEQDLGHRGSDSEALTVFGNPKRTDALGNVINQPDGAQLNPDGSMTVPPEVPAQSSPGVRAGAIPQVIPVTIGPGETVNVPSEEAWGDELTSPKTIAMIYHHIKRSPKQAWLYAKRKGRELGLSDQQILAKYKRTVRKLESMNSGTGQAGRRFQNRRRKF